MGSGFASEANFFSHVGGNVGLADALVMASMARFADMSLPRVELRRSFCVSASVHSLSQHHIYSPSNKSRSFHKTCAAACLLALNEGSSEIVLRPADFKQDLSLLRS